MSGSGRVGRALCSAAVCILSSYAVAALSAVAFRFPIPFGGYASGLDAARLTPLAVTFYGLLGGFVLQGALGVGATAVRLSSSTARLVRLAGVLVGSSGRLGARRAAAGHARLVHWPVVRCSVTQLREQVLPDEMQNLRHGTPGYRRGIGEIEGVHTIGIVHKC